MRSFNIFSFETDCEQAYNRHVRQKKEEMRDGDPDGFGGWSNIERYLDFYNLDYRYAWEDYNRILNKWKSKAFDELEAFSDELREKRMRDAERKEMEIKAREQREQKRKREEEQLRKDEERERKRAEERRRELEIKRKKEEARRKDEAVKIKQKEMEEARSLEEKKREEHNSKNKEILKIIQEEWCERPKVNILSLSDIIAKRQEIYTLQERKKIDAEEAERKANEDAERNDKEETERTKPDDVKCKNVETSDVYAIYADNVIDKTKAMRATKSLLGWNSTEFRKNTSDLPMKLTTIKGKANAEFLLRNFVGNGLICHIEEL